ncbi:GH32 C-terminal domain-containing protein [Allostreptomyces psammosilenae]|uniref:Levanbiose-producing levanase n=1 Tax=Allostreptomyces psammosilenae TaxID=1892865 RepID=A0A852ZZS5_9ACTN|nr:GH32 C-terminal domain-containing protein [Allostreptomyces psammosilenae]NYI03772.1 levanbiose-producing levanase [Allostreptomyces psammosilenae]
MSPRNRPSALSRRGFVLSTGLTLLGSALPAATAAAAPAGADGAPALPLAATDPTAIPDPIGVTGSWTRTADAGQRVVTAFESNAVAVSEQRVAANAVLGAMVTVHADTPFAVGSLVVRAAVDGSSGYAAGIDPNLGRVRLFDLATGQDLVPPAAFASQPGTAYHLEVALDGPALRVSVNGTTLLTANDDRYQHGVVALHAYNGTVTFGPPALRTITTNLTGWSTSGGTWTATGTGWRAAALADTNVRAVAGTRAHDVSLRADVLVHDPFAVATLLLRTNPAGTTGYALEVDPNLDRLRLYRIDGNVTLGTHSTPIATGTVYRVRVEAERGELRVHWQTDFIRPDGHAPAITATDTAHASGHLGVQVYNGSASFEEITASDVVTDLQGWRTASGAWFPDLRGIRSDGTVAALRTAPFPGGDALLGADVTLGGSRPAASAGLVFRAAPDGSGGYEARLDFATNTMALVDRATGARLATAAPPVRQIRPGVPYRVEVRAQGTTVEVHLDGVSTLRAAVTGTGGSRAGLAAGPGVACFQNVRVRRPGEYRTETYRPWYHHTQLAGHASDPNGLVYHEGEYHLFHQDQGRWAHAVSTDLVHWRELPVALPFSRFGHAWSGSAVVDAHDVSGLFGGGSGLVAFYTSYHPDRSGGNQCVRVAYSKDRGRSWEWYGEDPVVPNPGGPDGNWDFRDPKVIWDAEHGTWVMVVAGGDHVRFFTSTDLLTWRHVSSFGYGAWVTGGTWECPDFFPLPVDGDPNRVRWVLTLSTGPARHTDGSTCEYFVGGWDGTTFTSDTPAGTPLRADSGRDFYAAISFYGAPEGRRLWIGWMSNWDYAFAEPTAPWKGQLSVVRELTLSSAGGQGVRLLQRPVAELAALRAGTTSRLNVTVTPTSPNPLGGVTGVSYEIEAEIGLPATGAASEVRFGLREKAGQRTVVGYEVAASRLYLDRTASGPSHFTRYFAGRSTAALAPTTVGGERRLTLRMFVDASSVEVFGGDGRAAITSQVFPDPDARGMSFQAVGGTARLVAVRVHRLAGAYRVGDAVTPPPAAPSGGAFRGDLGPLTVTPGGRWTPSGAGLAGTFDKDSDALAGRELADLELTSLVRFGGPDAATSGAGSILLRASADGANGYCLNIDPNLRTVRLFTRVNGSFDDSMLLARVPVLVRTGTSYPVRVLAEGTRIQVFLCGERIIDVVDATFAGGRVGLNVFGGRAAYQDTYARGL